MFSVRAAGDGPVNIRRVVSPPPLRLFGIACLPVCPWWCGSLRRERGVGMWLGKIGQDTPVRSRPTVPVVSARGKIASHELYPLPHSLLADGIRRRQCQRWEEEWRRTRCCSFAGNKQSRPANKTTRRVVCRIRQDKSPQRAVEGDEGCGRPGRYEHSGCGRCGWPAQAVDDHR